MNDQVLGCLIHHTAGPAAGLYPSETVVVNGRPGLPGPLANLGLARDGTWIVVAAGSAWHAGTGSISWCPANQGNSRLIGIEAESTGVTKPNGDWTPQQRESYPRGVAALLDHLALPASRAIGHKEWAPTRKIDPAFWDMARFRTDVARSMTAPTPLTPASRGDWFDMADEADLRRIIREEVSERAVPDYYTGDDKDRMWLAECLAWGTTHAANARDAARSALAKATTIESKVDALLSRVVSGMTTAPPAGGGAGPGQLTDSELARVAKACADELDRRARTRLATP